MVTAIRNGWLKLDKEPEKKPEVWAIWNESGQVDDDDENKHKRLASRIPAPKPKLPGHAESYNPPAEYLFDEVRLCFSWRSISLWYHDMWDQRFFSAWCLLLCG